MMTRKEGGEELNQSHINPGLQPEEGIRFVLLSLPEFGCFFSDHTHLQLSGLKVHVEDRW